VCTVELSSPSRESIRMNHHLQVKLCFRPLLLGRVHHKAVQCSLRWCHTAPGNQTVAE
jgi:hypothetical protein